MKLWQKEHSSVHEKINAFTVGSDKDFDLYLAKYDVMGSLAHTEMLASVGLLSVEEKDAIHSALKLIGEDIEAGKFEIEEGFEDVHSQIEWLLTQKLGETGKKIHSGRSRNDQALLDIKLYLKEEIKEIAILVSGLSDDLLDLSEKHKNILLPGYTHFQLAMPSSFGLWFAAYAESLTDDLEMLRAAYRVVDQNPLGSGAGYGSSFPLDRTLTTELLGFTTMNYNSVYAQMTRGKSEKITAMALSCIAASLSKLAYDVCLYMNQNFGFISFPDELTTGSSIMPHKKNPDVFELIRAKCNRIQSLPNELILLTNNLPSGYHRDLQLTKECLFPAIGELKKCIQITGFMLDQIIVKNNILDDPKYDHLFSVEAVNQLVLNNVPFRDAYQQVGNSIAKREFVAPKDLNHSHEGSIGNMCNEKIKEKKNRVLAIFNLDK